MITPFCIQNAQSTNEKRCKIVNKNYNQLHQPGFGCIYCGKNYKTKHYLQRHQVLCENKDKAKKKSKSNNEEELPVPSQKQMYNIILDLTLKCNHLEEKVEEMQQWITNQKRKKNNCTNILEWLNNNQVPSQNLDTWFKSIKIQKKETEMILHKPFLNVLEEIWKRILLENQEEQQVLPIFTHQEKPQILYVFEENQWIEWSKEGLTRFLNELHFQYMKSFIELKKENEEKINALDSLSILYTETHLKLTKINFKKDTTFSKGKAILIHFF
jgi:hypothetical protein